MARAPVDVALRTRDGKTTRFAIDTSLGRLMVHRPSSKFTLQSDDLSPEAVALLLELGEALTKSAIFHERLGRPSGVDQSGRSLALSGAVARIRSASDDHFLGLPGCRCRSSMPRR